MPVIDKRTLCRVGEPVCGWSRYSQAVAGQMGSMIDHYQRQPAKGIKCVIAGATVPDHATRIGISWALGRVGRLVMRRILLGGTRLQMVSPRYGAITAGVIRFLRRGKRRAPLLACEGHSRSAAGRIDMGSVTIGSNMPVNQGSGTKQ